jgi:hypothetical protein
MQLYTTCMKSMALEHTESASSDVIYRWPMWGTGEIVLEHTYLDSVPTFFNWNELLETVMFQFTRIEIVHVQSSWFVWVGVIRGFSNHFALTFMLEISFVGACAVKHKWNSHPIPFQGCSWPVLKDHPFCQG